MAANQATGQEAGAVYVSVMPSGKGFSKAMDRDLDGAFTGAASRGTSTFGQMFRRVAAAGAAILATIGLGKLIKSTITLGASYNTLEQSSKAAFTTLLGTAEAAADMQKQIREFAMTSPFPRQAFIAGSQQLLAFGLSAKKVIPTLSAVQDAVAAAGGSSQQLQDVIFVMAQISAAGKITGADLLQFGQRGINAAELIGSQMGKTGAQIKAEITSGTLGADEALDALTAGMTAKFGGAAANLKGTWVGAVDRIKGAYRDLSSELVAPFIDPNGGGFAVKWANDFADLLRSIQASPAFDVLTKKLEGFGAKLDPIVQGSLKTLALLFEEDGPKKFGDALAKLAERFPGLQIFLSIMDALQPILPAVMDMISSLAPEVEKLAPYFADLVRELLPLIPPLAQLVVELAPSLIKLIPPLVDLLIPLVQLFIDAGPAVSFLADMLGWVVSVIAGGLGQWSKFFEMLSDGKITIAELVDFIFNIPGPLGDMVRGFANFAIGIMNAAINAINGITGMVAGVVNAVTSALGIGNVLNFRRIPHIPSVEQAMSMFGGGPGRGGPTGRFGPVAMADGGTILPRPGGTLILAAEAGRAESVVDTGKLNNLIDAAASKAAQQAPPKDDTPVRLHKSDLDYLARTLSGYVRNQSRKGAVV